MTDRNGNSSLSESDLLAKVQEDFSGEFWQRFGELRTRLRAETINEEERQEFVRLYAQVEGKNAERIGFIGELARLHGVSLLEVMARLNIGPIQMPDL